VGDMKEQSKNALQINSFHLYTSYSAAVTLDICSWRITCIQLPFHISGLSLYLHDDIDTLTTQTNIHVQKFQLTSINTECFPQKKTIPAPPDNGGHHHFMRPAMKGRATTISSRLVGHSQPLSLTQWHKNVEGRSEFILQVHFALFLPHHLFRDFSSSVPTF
jgi:hypothetical protein